jgi:hypothetical protein
LGNGNPFKTYCDDLDGSEDECEDEGESDCSAATNDVEVISS